MFKIVIKKDIYVHFLDYLLVVFLILNCQSLYQNSEGKNYYIYEITAILIVLDAIASVLRYKTSIKKIQNWFTLVGVYYLYICLFALFSVDSEYLFNFFSRFAVYPFVILIFIAKGSERVKGFIKKFLDVVLVIAVVSVAFWLLASVFHMISITSLFRFKWGEYPSYAESYYGVYFETQFVDWLSIVLRRNSSIFVEGPMYVLVLSVAYCFGVCFEKEMDFTKIKRIILIVTMISTFSVNGYIILIGIEVLNIMLLKKRRTIYILISLVIPIGIIAILYLIQMKSATNSFVYRIDDVLVGIKSWLQSPIVGKGFGDLSVITENMYNRKMTGYSISLLAILAQGGIMLGILYIWPILKLIGQWIKSKNEKCMVYAFVYLYLLCTIIFYTCFINFFIWIFSSLLLESREDDSLRNEVSNEVINNYSGLQKLDGVEGAIKIN